MQDIEPQDDGSILVGSSTDALKVYRLVGTTCECQDFTRGQAPEGWCQHRIAAGIARRVQERLAPPVPVEPDMVPEAFPDNDPEEPATPASPALPPTLPEAPASVNVRLTIDGRECQLTLRDTDEGRLLQRLSAVLAQYPQTPARTQGEGEAPACQYHGPMKASTKAPGTFFCTKKHFDGSYCRERYPQA